MRKERSGVEWKKVKRERSSSTSKGEKIKIREGQEKNTKNEMYEQAMKERKRRK